MKLISTAAPTTPPAIRTSRRVCADAQLHPTSTGHVGNMICDNSEGVQGGVGNVRNLLALRRWRKS